eukprot:2179039-Pleurochrysis_carterae.AAC.9
MSVDQNGDIYFNFLKQETYVANVKGLSLLSSKLSADLKQFWHAARSLLQAYAHGPCAPECCAPQTVVDA